MRLTGNRLTHSGKEAEECPTWAAPSRWHKQVRLPPVISYRRLRAYGSLGANRDSRSSQRARRIEPRQTSADCSALCRRKPGQRRMMQRDENMAAQLVISEGVVRAGRIAIAIDECVMPHVFVAQPTRL